MENFIDKIEKQLKLMTDKEKDAWILSQAKILPTWMQEDQTIFSCFFCRML